MLTGAHANLDAQGEPHGRKEISQRQGIVMLPKLRSKMLLGVIFLLALAPQAEAKKVQVAVATFSQSVLPYSRGSGEGLLPGGRLGRATDPHDGLGCKYGLARRKRRLHLYGRERDWRYPSWGSLKIYDLVLPGLTADGSVSPELQKKVVEFILKVQGLKKLLRRKRSSTFLPSEKAAPT